MKSVLYILIVVMVIISGSNLAVADNNHFSSKKDGISSGNSAFGDDFRLYQNYPNPFNPSTTISYKLNSEGFVSLKVYNLVGQEVRTLVDNYQKPGVYQVTFDASEFTSGIYIYKLQMNGSTSVRRMTLLK
ncbi:MAG TPA: hypothetical protein DEP28_09990 [Bacteroidetes bacterium]|nr:hypothetical protein [Bacteroidota bacterium]HCN37355.1 hypothetical protein [Bacteroidota bacterium]